MFAVVARLLIPFSIRWSVSNAKGIVWYSRLLIRIDCWYLVRQFIGHTKIDLKSNHPFLPLLFLITILHKLCKILWLFVRFLCFTLTYHWTIPVKLMISNCTYFCRSTFVHCLHCSVTIEINVTQKFKSSPWRERKMRVKWIYNVSPPQHAKNEVSIKKRR